MRIRASVVLYIPLLTVLVTGCTDEAPPAKVPTTDAVKAPTGNDATTKAPKKKKDPQSFTGPTDVVP